MQNSTQGGFVCCTVLDVFNLCTQVLRALYSQNIHFINYGHQTKKTLTVSSSVTIHCQCQKCMHACTAWNNSVHKDQAALHEKQNNQKKIW